MISCIVGWFWALVWLKRDLNFWPSFLLWSAELLGVHPHTQFVQRPRCRQPSLLFPSPPPFPATLLPSSSWSFSLLLLSSPHVSSPSSVLLFFLFVCLFRNKISWIFVLSSPTFSKPGLIYTELDQIQDFMYTRQAVCHLWSQYLRAPGRRINRSWRPAGAF